MKFNEKIVILRKRKGFSQEDLANELDVSRQSVYKWETGESIPDMNKIRKIVKIFNISFDNLLDDGFDITVGPNSDSLDAKNTKPKPKKYRPVFVLDKVIFSNQAAIDNDYKPYTKGSPSGIKLDLMKKHLDEYGADSTIPLQPDLAACFFQNSKNLTFGFYFDEEIQFVCPYENYIGSTVSKTGSVVPTPLFSGPSNYCLNISYFDENGNINEYVLPLQYDSGRSYVFNKYRKDGEAELFLSHIASCTSRHMDDIQNKLMPLTAIAEKIHSGETEAPFVDIQTLKEKARSPRSEEYYKKQNQMIEDNISSDQVKAIMGVVGFIAAIIIIAAIAYSYMF